MGLALVLYKEGCFKQASPPCIKPTAHKGGLGLWVRTWRDGLPAGAAGCTGTALRKTQRHGPVAHFVA